jgi:hypothetical protein
MHHRHFVLQSECRDLAAQHVLVVQHQVHPAGDQLGEVLLQGVVAGDEFDISAVMGVGVDIGAGLPAETVIAHGGDHPPFEGMGAGVAERVALAHGVGGAAVADRLFGKGEIRCIGADGADDGGEAARPRVFDAARPARGLVGDGVAGAGEHRARDLDREARPVGAWIAIIRAPHIRAQAYLGACGGGCPAHQPCTGTKSGGSVRHP